MITNHYGHTVDSDTPVIGVLSIHDVAWEFINDEHCLTCAEIIKDINQDDSLDNDELQNELDSVECDSSHTKIIGDWLMENHFPFEWYPDENGEFSAIVNESTIQVVWSRYTTHGRLCSPCYPGQLDVDIDDNTGDFIGYTLPDELLYKPD